MKHDFPRFRLGWLASFALLAVALGACGGGGGGGGGTQQQTQSLSIGVIGVEPASLAYYIAKDAGLFTTANLEITTVSVTPQTGPQALAGGSLDILWDGPNVVSVQLQQPEIKAIGISMHLPVFIITKPGSGVSSVKDLKGKTVAISAPGGTFDTFAKGAIKAGGLAPGTDVKLTYVGTADAINAAVAAGTVSAGTANFNSLQDAKSKGLVQVPVPDASKIPGTAGFLGIDTKNVGSKKDALKRFMKVVSDTAKYAQNPSNKSKVVATIAKYYQLNDQAANEFYQLHVPVMLTNLAVPPDEVTTALESLNSPDAKGKNAKDFIDNNYLPS